MRIVFSALLALAGFAHAGGDPGGGGGLPEKFKRTFILENMGSLQGEKRLPHKIVLVGDQHNRTDGRRAIIMLVFIGNNQNKFTAFYDGNNTIHEAYTDKDDYIKFEFNMNRSLSDDTLYLNGTFTIFRGRARIKEKVVRLNYVGKPSPGLPKSLINGSPDDFKLFTDTVRCSLVAEKRVVRAGSYPVFHVTIHYDGSNPFTLQWDKDFGHVLWIGRFIMIAKTSGKEYSTKGLGSITSGTYPPREQKTLSQGSIITARLDFSTYPARSVSKIFPRTGTVDVQLYLRYSSPKGELLMPLGNKVRIVIR